MAKVGVVVLADTETHADLGRVVNAIETVKESAEHDDDIEFIFDVRRDQMVAGTGSRRP